jgi:hypothetical protein
MLNIRDWSVRFLAVALVAGTSFAQTPEPPKFYKLDFVVKEVEGAKVLNARSYSITVSTDASSPHSSIRTGSKVPTPTGATGQYSFIDLAVNIDCGPVKAIQDGISLTVTVEISGVVQDSTTPASTTLPPVIRQNRWGSSVVLPIKKPTIIFSSDDTTTKRQMQMELTATPIR